MPEENDSSLHEEKSAAEQEKPKSAFQKRKEEWYDRVDLSVKQLDIIIAICFGALLLVFILIGLEAAGIFSLFHNH